jgi:hypothetical protein
VATDCVSELWLYFFAASPSAIAYNLATRLCSYTANLSWISSGHERTNNAIGSKAIQESIDKQDVHDTFPSAKSTLPQYVYIALGSPKSIRLINLLPCDTSQADQRLKCELKVVSLSENPSFFALSYTWGEDVFSETLICENQIFNITKNLHDALVQFSSPTAL